MPDVERSKTRFKTRSDINSNAAGTNPRLRDCESRGRFAHEIACPHANIPEQDFRHPFLSGLSLIYRNVRIVLPEAK